jgi:LPS sulfotransferase NodH
MKAVFIVGEQRSGSNLLRLMLAQAGIAAPDPTHLLARMMPLAASSVARARFKDRPAVVILVAGVLGWFVLEQGTLRPGR